MAAPTRLAAAIAKAAAGARGGDQFRTAREAAKAAVGDDVDALNRIMDIGEAQGLGRITEAEASERFRNVRVRDDAAAPATKAEFAAAKTGGQQPLVRNVAVGELRTGLDTIESPGDAAHVIASIRKSAQEEFLAIVTDTDGKVLEVLRHTKGTSDAAAVDPGSIIGEIADVPRA